MPATPDHFTLALQEASQASLPIRGTSSDTCPAIQDSVLAMSLLLVASSVSSSEPSLNAQGLQCASNISSALELLQTVPQHLMKSACVAHLAVAAAATAEHGLSHTTPQRQLLLLRLQDAGSCLLSWDNRSQTESEGPAWRLPHWRLLAGLFVKLLLVHTVQSGHAIPAPLVDQMMGILHAAPGAGISVDVGLAVQQHTRQKPDHQNTLSPDVVTKVKNALEEDLASVLDQIGASTPGTGAVLLQPTLRVALPSYQGKCACLSIIDETHQTGVSRWQQPKPEELPGGTKPQEAQAGPARHTQHTAAHRNPHSGTSVSHRSGAKGGDTQTNDQYEAHVYR